MKISEAAKAARANYIRIRALEAVLIQIARVFHQPGGTNVRILEAIDTISLALMEQEIRAMEHYMVMARLNRNDEEPMRMALDQATRDGWAAVEMLTGRRPEMLYQDVGEEAVRTVKSALESVFGVVSEMERGAP